MHVLIAIKRRPGPPSTGAQNGAMQLRQKLLHDVCHQFRMTGKRTVVFFGAARMDANAGARAEPDKWWEFGGVFFFFFFLYFRITIGGRLRPEPSVGD